MGLLEAYDAVISPPNFSPDDNSSAHWLWFAGLVSIADWIASNKDYFCHGWRGFSSGEDYFTNAFELAEKALEEIGWTSRREEWDTPKLSQWLSIVTGSKIVQSRPMQDAGEELLQESENEPVLIIVEAPMGEGKTEFALRAHEHLHKHCGHRGLYFALPTQATANAMYERVKNYVDRRFPDIETHVQLAHGGVKKTGIPWNAGEIHDKNEKEGAAIAGMWFSQRRRAILSAFGVGTIDQALLACLPVKHHFVPLFGLGNRVVVLDEIHAYDAYTDTLIECLLEWLRDMRCSVILMSATLPEKCRNSYIQKWTKQTDCLSGNRSRPYPSISLVTAKDGEKVCEFETNEKNIRVEATESSINDIVDWCKEKLKGGGRGAVILNTVGRAQKLYKELKRSEVNAKILLYHARFPADERLQTEQRVLQICGRNGNIDRPFLLVATQVAEQSLDADFDFMLSDLAPIDLLLQRAGRLHRHERPRPPAHQRAIFTIAGGGGDNPPDVTEWDRIYDRYYLLATWHLLKEGGQTWCFPKDIDRLVQRLYGDETLYSLTNEKEDLSRRLGKCEQYARENCVYPTDNENRDPSSFDDGKDFMAETRLSDGESLRIVPIFVDEEKRYLRQSGDEELDEANPFSLYERILSIRHRKMIKMAKDCPAYWEKIQEKNPLLRDVWGVEFFRESGRMVKSEGIKISCKLGVDYSSVENSGT